VLLLLAMAGRIHPTTPIGSTIRILRPALHSAGRRLASSETRPEYPISISTSTTTSVESIGNTLEKQDCGDDVMAYHRGLPWRFDVKAFVEKL
jgi:hypothetical protein